MSISSISSRPVASFNTTPAAQASAPAGLSMLVPSEGQKAITQMRLAPQPDGFDKGLLEKMGPGPVIPGTPQELAPKQDLNQTLESLTQELGPMVDLLDGPGTSAPVSAQDKVQDIAHEALSGRLEDLTQSLDKRLARQNLPGPAMAVIRQPGDRADMMGAQKNQLNNGMKSVLSDVRGMLAEGGAQNLAQADKALDVVEKILDPKGGVSAKEGVEQLTELLGKKPSSAPQKPVLPSLHDLKREGPSRTPHLENALQNLRLPMMAEKLDVPSL